MPFRIVSLDTQTIFIVPTGNLRLGFGLNLLVSTAFGIVKQLLGLSFAHSVKLSLHAWLTQIEASMSFKYHLHILFRLMHPISLYVKCVCSVMTVLRPRDLAITMTIAIVMLVLR